MVLHRLRPLIAAAALACAGPLSASDPGFRIDAPHPGKPYTHLNFNNRAENFQFIIMGDRTGGERAGVFQDAIVKLNLLQPEFVISVGDLIAGYTTNTAEVLRQWDEFDALVHQLEMPYFYVAGNHDLSNEPMVKIWEERRGRRYYHFLYHDVLFLVLNTDDPFPVQMSEEQVAYFERVLKENPNPRWTLVFMHNPAWRLEPTPRQQRSGHAHENRFSRFDELLAGRKYTLFAGHTHNYTYERRNGGADHLVIATTGGGSQMRGARTYGEFDAIVWVTMTDDGPVLANLALDGIQPKDVRTVETSRIVNRATGAAPAGTLIRSDAGTFTSGTATIPLENPTSVPLNIRLEFDAPAPLAVEPARLEADLAPGERQRAEVTVTAPEATALDDITAPVSGTWTIAIDSPTTATDEPLEFSGEFSLTVDGVRTIARAPRAVTVDGNLGDWEPLPLAVTQPEPPNRRWTGPRDGSFRWGAATDDEHLYLAIRTRDNRLYLNPDRPPHQQDGIEFRIDARSDPERSRGRALWNYTDHGLVMVAPPRRPGGEPAIYVRPASLAEVAKVRAVPRNNGFTAEVAIPHAWLDGQQGTTWSALRLNAAMHDYDAPAHRRAKHLWWRPDWRTPRNVEASGTFHRE